MDGYSVLRWFFRGVLRVGFGLEVTGAARIPAAGPAVLAVNHGSQIDPLVLAAAVPRRCTFLAAAELLTMPVLGALIRPFRVVPIERGRFDRRAIQECLARLERGELLAIFPEGKISSNGDFHPPCDGLAFIAARARVPVIPIGIAGTYDVWPLGARLPRRGRIAVRIGEAFVPAEAPTRRDQSALTARVMDAIVRLSRGPVANQPDAEPASLPLAG